MSPALYLTTLGQHACWCPLPCLSTLVPRLLQPSFVSTSISHTVSFSLAWTPLVLLLKSRCSSGPCPEPLALHIPHAFVGTLICSLLLARASQFCMSSRFPLQPTISSCLLDFSTWTSLTSTVPMFTHHLYTPCPLLTCSPSRDTVAQVPNLGSSLNSFCLLPT